MSWVIFAIFTGVFYAVSDAFTKVASENISPFLGVTFVHVTSGLLALLTFGIIYFAGYQKGSFISSEGVTNSLLAGFFVFIGSVSFFVMFAKSAPLGISITLIAVVVALTATLLSAIFFKEIFSIKQYFGVALSCLGIYLLVVK